MLYKLLEGGFFGPPCVSSFFKKLLEVFLTNLQNGSIIKAMSSFANRSTLDLPEGEKVLPLPPYYLVMGDEVGENQRAVYGTSVQAIGPLGETVYIGRSEENDIVVKGDPFVSRYHCKLIRCGSGYYLQDLNSRNATYEEGGKVIEGENVRLNHGDMIEMGLSRFVMLNPGELAPREEKFNFIKLF